MQKTRIIGLSALLLGLASTLPAATIGFSISDTTKILYRIDLETGAATSLGVIPFADDDDLEGLTSIGTRVLAVSEANFGNGTLWDVTTPPGVLIGSTGNRFGTEAGAAYNPVSGILYNLNANDDPAAGAVGSELYQINTTTGAATMVGSRSSIYADGLAINAAGVAFASDFRLTDSLYQVNLGTGALTLVGGFNVGNVNFDSGLEFAPDGVLWALTENGSIYTVNTSTGAATFRANVTVNGVAFSQADGGELEGLAIPVPEPRSLALLGAGLVGVLAFRRRASVA